ncbi:MAG: acyl-CoA carboxylase biotin carboxyl carrier protein subunit [Planctomycetota bacterium]|jgi:biotin carboxyl carrier protein
MKYFARIGDHEVECIVEGENGDLYVTIEGRRCRAELRHLARAKSYSLLLDGRSFEFAVDETDDGLELSGGAGTFHVTVEDARTHAARSKTAVARGAQGPRVTKAVMPGIVREVRVEPGAEVAKGQPLLILEAMKMQNEIRAEHAGVVTNVFVTADETVDKGAKLVEIE